MPDPAADVDAFVSEALSQCRMSIHLVGRTYSLVPEGGQQSIIEVQNELAIIRAAAGSFSRLVWIPPGLRIADDRQRRVVEAIRVDPRIADTADVLETPLTDLRTQIAAWLEDDEPAAPTAAAGSVARAKGVYLIYDKRDADRVGPWADYLFKEKKLEIVRSLFDGDEAEVRAYHEESLRHCDAALIFHGAGGELWLQRKLREVRKSAGYGRTTPAPVVGICLIGPRTPEKEQFRHARRPAAAAVGRPRSRGAPAVRVGLAGTCQGRLSRMPPPPQANPFPGLRPFEPDEDHLFFGREQEIDDLLRQLRHGRFLSVIGTSGCGKSSLVRSGLIPSLHSGLMVNAGSTWRVAIARPGEDPIGHLAAALDQPRVLGWQEAGELAATNRVMLEATLRRGTLGLVEAIDQAHLPASDNVLVLVDQFEELFRFRRVRDAESSREEAVAYVNLLLEAAAQRDLPIYVVVTMRSDFIGECMDYPGLPEALNHGQYLVPRMTRDELRSAITGPVAVAGGAIAPRLVRRLLNDIGDNQDELPVLQHALMRTWEHWHGHNAPASPIDLVNYESIGTLRKALSLHAEEAYAETLDEPRPWITQRVFKALTDTYSDPRGVRRPTSIAEMASACEVGEDEVIRIVEIFRRPGRSFLMPPSPVPLTSRTIVDLSHESLMRCWPRLMRWAKEERASGELYSRLSREAAWHASGKAGLWDDPELELGLRWLRLNHPTAAWARRYDDAFDRAMAFLDASERERTRQREERRSMRIRRLLFAWGTAAVLLVMTGVLLVLWVRASRAQDLARQNFQAAREAVNELLSSVDRDVAGVGADSPEVQQLRRQLLEKANTFYIAFSQIRPDSDEVVNDLAVAHLRLGQINRMLDAPTPAIDHYNRGRSCGSASSWRGTKPTRATGRRWPTPTTGSARRTARSRARAQKPKPRTDGPWSFRARSCNRRPRRCSISRNSRARTTTAASCGTTRLPPAIRRRPWPKPTSGRPWPCSSRSRNRPTVRRTSRIWRGRSTISRATSATIPRAPPRRSCSRHGRSSCTPSSSRRSPATASTGWSSPSFPTTWPTCSLRAGDINEATKSNRRAQELLDDLVRPAPALGIEHADAHTIAGFIFERDRPQDAIRRTPRHLRIWKK